MESAAHVGDEPDMTSTGLQDRFAVTPKCMLSALCIWTVAVVCTTRWSQAALIDKEWQDKVAAEIGMQIFTEQEKEQSMMEHMEKGCTEQNEVNGRYCGRIKAEYSVKGPSFSLQGLFEVEASHLPTVSSDDWIDFDAIDKRVKGLTKLITTVGKLIASVAKWIIFGCGLLWGKLFASYRSAQSARTRSTHQMQEATRTALTLYYEPQSPRPHRVTHIFTVVSRLRSAGEPLQSPPLDLMHWRLTLSLVKRGSVGLFVQISGPASFATILRILSLPQPGERGMVCERSLPSGTAGFPDMLSNAEFASGKWTVGDALVVQVELVPGQGQT